jgi:lysophospholipase L1-like esterase
MNHRRPHRLPGTPRNRQRASRAGISATFRPPPSRSGLKVATALLGVLASLLVGAVVFFTVGERTGLVLFVGLLAVVFLLAALASNHVLALVVVLELGVVFWTGWQIAVQAKTVVTALSTTQGPTAPADGVALAAAEQRAAAAGAETAFRLELTESQLTAVLQDALAQREQPLRTITIDAVSGPASGHGHLDFEGQFKSGGYQVQGRLKLVVVGGILRVEIERMSLGSLNLPGVAKSAVEQFMDQLLGSAEEVNALLAEAQVELQSVSIDDTSVVITGVRRGNQVVTSADLLQSLSAAAVGTAVTPPAEVLSPGVVGESFTEGSTYYLALGDSLAASVGVADLRQGYVSRVHNELQIADGLRYGLMDLGTAGETSGSLIRDGQLDEALAFLDANEVAYITLDIGANDLLGHLTSSDCSTGLATPACSERLSGVSSSYLENITEIFSSLREAAPEVPIVFLEAYNPFSLGTGIQFEQDSNRALQEFNEIAAITAGEYGILVADGFSPMWGTAASTTHLLDSPPDIHPNSLGYSLLAQAVLEALG